MKKKIIVILGFLLIIIAINFLFIINKRVPQNPNKKEEVQIEENVKKGTFEYMPIYSSESKEETYYYSDDYFLKSGKEQNEHLRTMSICMALASTTAADKDDKAANIKNLFEDLEFENIEIADLYDETSENTIGSAIASKKIGDTYLIAVSIRGSRYQNEWISNFKVGEEGDVKGFSEASIKIISRIKDYKDTYEIDNCKIWIAGYSRAGAVANLSGKYINEKLDEFNTTPDDIYIYTFEAPFSSSSNAVYENIHNVIDQNDFFTYIFPKGWGLYNNGVEEILVTNSQKLNKTEFKYLKGILVEKINQNGEIETIETKEFLEDFINWLSIKKPIIDFSISREKYVSNIEQPLGSLIELFLNKDNTERQEIFEFFYSTFVDLIKEGKLDFVKDSFSDLKNAFLDDDKFEPIKRYVDEAYELSDVPLTKEELEAIENSFKSISKVILPLIISGTMDGSDSGANLEASGFYHIATFINNFPKIINNHYTQNNLKLVQQNDSYYTNNK